MTQDEISIQLLYKDVIDFHFELESSGTAMRKGVIDEGRIEARVRTFLCKVQILG